MILGLFSGYFSPLTCRSKALKRLIDINSSDPGILLGIFSPVAHKRFLGYDFHIGDEH